MRCDGGVFDGSGDGGGGDGMRDGVGGVYVTSGGHIRCSELSYSAYCFSV